MPILLSFPIDVGKSIAVGWGHRSIRMVLFQDDIKLRPNLTVNIGLRYEYITPYVEVRPPDQLRFDDR